MLILLLVDAALVFGWALLVCAMLRLSTRPALLIGWFVLAYANIVFTTEIAGTFFLAGSRTFYLLAHLGLLLAAGWVWWRVGRPPLFGTMILWKLKRPGRSEPVLWVLGIGVALTYLMGVVVILVAPPNIPDAVTYHLSRVGYWLQHGSLYHWPTYDLRQTAFPINYELSLLWITTFVRNDMLLGFVQWGAMPVTMLGVIGLARILGHTRSEALFAALLMATFPLVILHAVGIKNDLLLSAFVVGALYLLLLGLRERRWGPILLSALAVGIAAGIKTTLVMLMPGMVVFGLLLARQYGLRWLLGWGVACAIAFLLLGSYNYLLNWIAYGHPLGTEEFVETESAPDSGSISLVTNLFRYSYQAADTSELPSQVHEAKAWLARPLFDLAGIPVTSDTGARRTFDLDVQPERMVSRVWLGPIGAVLLFAIPVYAVIAVRRRDVITFGMVLLAVSFFIMLSLIVGWTPNKGRYVAMVAAVLAPLMASWYRRPALLKWALCGLALYMAGVTITTNEHAPLIGEHAIWQGDRYELQGQETGRADMLRTFDKIIPADARIGLVFQRSDWDYPFFGVHFTRTLIQIYPFPRHMGSAWLAQQGFDYILMRDTTTLMIPIPSSLVRVQSLGGYTLLRYVPNDQ